MQCAGCSDQHVMTKPKLPLLLAGLALAGLVFLAWTQQWLTVTLNDGTILSVDGSVAAPAASILALTCLVVFPALAIAGRVFRGILGALESLLGLTIAFSSVLAIAQPVSASASVVSTATGVTGHDSVAELVADAALTPWPFVSLSAGVLLVIVGVLVIVTARRWPDSGRKYSAVRTAPAGLDDAAASWDALSASDDPTRER
jgi:hypothetical protein